MGSDPGQHPQSVYRKELLVPKSKQTTIIGHSECSAESLFLYQVAIKEILFGGTGISPVPAQAKVCGYHELFFDCNSVLDRRDALLRGAPFRMTRLFIAF